MNRGLTRSLTATLLAATLAGPFAARAALAQAPTLWQPPQPARALQPDVPPPRSDLWQIAAGGGGLLIKSAGFDPFSTDDGLSRFSLSATRVVWRQERLALAVGLSSDAGTSNAHARGASSELGLLLFSAVAEARYAFGQRVYTFARLSPGVQHGSARLEEPSAPAGSTLVSSFTTPTLAGSAGAAFCLTGPFTSVGAWLVADGGYLLAPSSRLVMRPDIGDAASAPLGALDLGTIAPGGPFLRLSFALSF
jgi:hypothetical protein